MKLELEITPHAGYLGIRVTGSLSLPDANAALIRILEAAAEHESERVLVDCTALQGSFSTLERFQHSQFGAEQVHSFSARGLPPDVRFAYVVVPPALDPDRFGETVAVNRGVNVRVFELVEDAVRWLEADPGSSPDNGEATR